MDAVGSSTAADLMRIATDQMSDRVRKAALDAEAGRVSARQEVMEQLLGPLSPDVGRALDIRA